VKPERWEKKCIFSGRRRDDDASLFGWRFSERSTLNVGEDFPAEDDLIDVPAG
jgi:hypothetical protein